MIPGLAAAGPGPCVQVTVRWDGSRWTQGDAGRAQILPGLRPASDLWSLGSASLFQVSQTSHRLLHVSDMAGPETTHECKEIP